MDVEQADVGPVLPRGGHGRGRVVRLGDDGERAELERGTNARARRHMVVGDHDGEGVAHGRTSSTRGSLPGPGRHGQPPAELLRPLAHAHETEARPTRLRAVDLEPSSVVDNPQAEARPALELDAHRRRTAVPNGVRDRLADDADERVASRGLDRDAVADVQANARPHPVGEIGDDRLEGRVERLRAGPREGADREPRLLQRALRGLLERGEPVQLAVAEGEELRLRDEVPEVLGDPVVEFAREPAALLRDRGVPQAPVVLGAPTLAGAPKRHQQSEQRDQPDRDLERGTNSWLGVQDNACQRKRHAYERHAEQEEVKRLGPPHAHVLVVPPVSTIVDPPTGTLIRAAPARPIGRST